MKARLSRLGYHSFSPLPFRLHPCFALRLLFRPVKVVAFLVCAATSPIFISQQLEGKSLYCAEDSRPDRRTAARELWRGACATPSWPVRWP